MILYPTKCTYAVYIECADSYMALRRAAVFSIIHILTKNKHESNVHALWRHVKRQESGVRSLLFTTDNKALNNDGDTSTTEIT